MRGYRNYRGKRNGKRTLLVVLLVAVLLLATVFLKLQNYIVYDSQGNMSLDLPFFQKKEDPPPTDFSNTPLEVLEPSAEQAGEQENTVFRVTERPLYDLWAESDPQPEAGCSALLTEIKGEDGTYFYQSDLAVSGAVDANAVSRSALNQRLEEPRDWTAVAAIHCFRDDYYAMADMEGAGICQKTGYIWFGPDNAHWLEPSKLGTREYLCAVAAECSAMGFDEVLLRSFGYPDQGNLDKIDYSGMQMSKGEALERFLRDMRDALGEDMLLSVELPAEDILAGGNDVTGIELARIIPLVDRLYIQGTADRAQLEERLAPVLDERDLCTFLVMEKMPA